VLSSSQRTGELAAIITIRMFVARLPVCSLLHSVKFVKGTISFMPFSPPAPVPAVFAALYRRLDELRNEFEFPYITEEPHYLRHL
jgi:hypothetical protein